MRCSSNVTSNLVLDSARSCTLSRRTMLYTHDDLSVGEVVALSVSSTVCDSFSSSTFLDGVSSDFSLQDSGKSLSSTISSSLLSFFKGGVDSSPTTSDYHHFPPSQRPPPTPTLQQRPSKHRTPFD